MDVEQLKMEVCLCPLVRCLQTDSWRIVSAGDDKTLKVRLLRGNEGLISTSCLLAFCSL